MSLTENLEGYLNAVNLVELYYVLCRMGKDLVEEREWNISSFGVKIVPVRDKSELLKKAAIIKAENAVSLADSFAPATQEPQDRTRVESSFRTNLSFCISPDY